VNVEFEDIAGFDAVGTGTKDQDTLTVEGLQITGKTSGVARVTVSLQDDGSVLDEVIVVVPGDVNRDGRINVGDSTALKNYVNSDPDGRNTSGFGVYDDRYILLLANINRDVQGGSARINVNDVTALTSYLNSDPDNRNTSGWL
jgi:hypothetical protein